MTTVEGVLSASLSSLSLFVLSPFPLFPALLSSLPSFGLFVGSFVGVFIGLMGLEVFVTSVS